MTAGNLQAGSLAVGWGTFSQTGGKATIQNALSVARSGTGGSYPDTATYELSGTGQLVAKDVKIGNAYAADAWFKQTGGSHTVTNSIELEGGKYTPPGGSTIYYTSRYDLSGGSLSVSSLTIGKEGRGLVNQSGGTASVTTRVDLAKGTGSGNGTYTLSGGTLTAPIIYGWNSNTILNIDGGMLSLGTSLTIGSMNIGSRAGTNGQFALVAGRSIEAQSMMVGHGGAGSLTQTGGTLAVGGNMFVGLEAGANGSYELSAGSFSASSVWLGTSSATGRVTQTGGSATISGPINLNGGNATYSLGGSGTLSATSISQDGGSFQQSGGQAIVSGSVSVGAQYTLSGGQLNTDSLTVGNYSVASPSAFAQSGGTNVVTGTLAIGASGAPRGKYTLSGGLLVANTLTLGGGYEGTLDYANAAAEIVVTSSLKVQPNSTLMAVPGATIRMTGSSFSNTSTNADSLMGLNNMTLIFKGGASHLDPFEVASFDVGTQPDGWVGNFALGALQLGEGAAVGRVQLVNGFDNQPAWAGVEALYVDSLLIGPGSYLDLNGLTLYYRTMSNNGGTVALNGGRLVAVPESGVLGLLAIVTGLLLRRRCSVVNGACQRQQGRPV